MIHGRRGDPETEAERFRAYYRAAYEEARRLRMFGGDLQPDGSYLQADGSPSITEKRARGRSARAIRGSWRILCKFPLPDEQSRD